MIKRAGDSSIDIATACELFFRLSGELWTYLYNRISTALFGHRECCSHLNRAYTKTNSAAMTVER